jgi:hypothetical protein
MLLKNIKKVKIKNQLETQKLPEIKYIFSDNLNMK